MKKPILKYEYNINLYLYKSNYINNNRLFLALTTDSENKDEDYDLYGDITINLPEYMIEDDNVVFISGDLPTEIYNDLVNVGLLEEIDVVQYNWGRYKKCIVNEKVLKEYTEDINE